MLGVALSPNNVLGSRIVLDALRIPRTDLTTQLDQQQDTCTRINCLIVIADLHSQQVLVLACLTS